jgi:hypothetical protein
VSAEFLDRVNGERVRPHSLDAEKAVLGAILINPALFDDARIVLGGSDFYRHAHRLIYGAVDTLAKRGQPPDLVTLSDELARAGKLDDAGGPAYLASLTDGVPRSTNIEHYARIVLDRARDRRALAALERAAGQIHDGERDQALQSLRVLSDELPDDAHEDILLEPAASVAARESAAGPVYLVADVLPVGCVGLWFGAERTFKSLAARELAAAVAMGRPLFHLDRLAVREPAPVAYVTEEDDAGAVLGHLNAFTGGAASRPGQIPLYLSACRGITLDHPRTQDRILRELAVCQPALVILEPLRSLTAAVDQGPRELQPLTQFLRRIIRETGAAVLIGHHAVKTVAGHDGRRGAQRVSGGGLVSISEAPAEFVRLDDYTVTFTPRGFKHAATPAPLTLTLETASGRVTRLSAEDYSKPPSDEEQAAEGVLTVVRAEPGLSGTAIAARVGGRKAAVFAALPALKARGEITEKKALRGSTWFPS